MRRDIPDVANREAGMAEDKPEDVENLSDSGRARRTPPTIDLTATDVSGETANEANQSEASDTAAEANPKQPSAVRHPLLASAVISAASGACMAALMVAALWLSGWPGETSPSAAPVSSAAVDDLAARIAGIESKINKPAAPDAGLAARLDATEKSVAALRAQSDRLAADLKEARSQPGQSSAAVDLGGISQRIDALERATRAQGAEIAQANAQASAQANAQESAKQNAQANAKPADDMPLRRIVAASLLDVLVRIGDPYPAALAAAKSLAPDPDILKPLDAFASSGVPTAAILSRELLALVPKLSPPPAENAGAGAGLVDRLQAGAAKLVRIERTDIHGTDRGNVVARVTAAALRNDYNEARRELNTLPPADRTSAQGWIEKADARDAALAVSRQFATEAMTALAKPAP
jgi:hypothetical protein